MKAARYQCYGNADQIRIESVDIPTHSDTELLIELHASAVNSADIRLRKADPFLVRFFFGLFKPKHKILGISFSGKVIAIGSKVTRFRVNDELFGLSEAKLGCHAEFVAIDENNPIAFKPNQFSHESAAAIPFGAHTAYYFLKSTPQLSMKKVLVYGASGSVGLAVVQLAKHFGAEVTAVCGTAHQELLNGFADRVLDYQKNDISTIGEKFDLIFDTVNKISPLKLAPLCHKNGRLILGAALIKELFYAFIIRVFWGVKVVMGAAIANAEDMEIIRNYCEKSVFKAVIDRQYTLDEIVSAHRYVESGHKAGNVVINLKAASSGFY